MGSLFGKKPKVIQTGDIADKSFASTLNQYGPGFRTEYGVDPSGNRYQRFVETGDQLALTDARGDIGRALAPYGQTLAGNVGAGDAVERSMAADLQGGRNAYEKATFDRAMALLAPRLDQQERNVRNTLVNTGNPIGTERAALELDMLNRNRSTQLNDLALGSILAGLQGQGQQINNLNAYGQGRRANVGADIGNVGNIFSILQADRPQYFQADQLLSPETVLNRSLAKASTRQARNAGLDAITAGLLSGGSRIAAAGMA